MNEVDQQIIRFKEEPLDTQRVNPTIYVQNLNEKVTIPELKNSLF